MSDLVLMTEATVPQLLNELARRYEELPEIPRWAEPVVITVAGFYRMPLEMILSKRRNDETVKVRHLVISLLSQLNPNRTRSEVCDIVGLGHEMYHHAIAKTDERCGTFPEFRDEIRQVLAAIKTQGHCRTSPQTRNKKQERGGE